MKKLLKILPILMTVLMTLMAVTPIFASPLDKIDINQNPQNADQFWNVGNNVLGIIQIVGTVIAVGVLMVLGIKYMMGSAEEKAEYKKTMLPYIIGAVILFAAVNLAKAVTSLASGLTATK